MPQVISAVILLLFALPALAAQIPLVSSQQPAPVLNVTTRLVYVDVVVRDGRASLFAA